MLRKSLMPTVIVSILILLTTLTTITIPTEAAATSVKTSKSIRKIKSTTTTPFPLQLTTTTLKSTIAKSETEDETVEEEKEEEEPSNISATVFQLTNSNTNATKTTTTAATFVNKFLNNINDETTTSLLPLQPPLNVTSTTLASFILNQKHHQQQRQRKQQQLLYLQLQQQQQQQILQQQREHRQVQNVKGEETQHELNEKEDEQQKFHEHLLNVNENGNKEIIKKNLDNSFVTVTSVVDVITPEPSSTHAYIPFDLDYSDPTEEKALKESQTRQSTINEVLTNLFPKGFSDIFRFSYAGDPETTTKSTSTTTTTAKPITIIRSTPTPFKPMPVMENKKQMKTELPKNATIITVSTSVTREIRREVRPGHTEIVVEKIITEPSSYRSSEEFRDGSNSISKDDLLRINRAAREASVLPSMLVNPVNTTGKNLTDFKVQEPIVILNENNNDDFVEAPEDDNQIAESQDAPQQIVVAPPHAESTNYHVTPSHQYNVRIIHADQKGERHSSSRNGPSYQSFVEHSKYLQNSLNEAPSRKYLKNFQNPILSHESNTLPISKGNFHYEQGSAGQNHIQTVPPAAQLQYVQQQPLIQQYQKLHTHIINSEHSNVQDIYQVDTEQDSSAKKSIRAPIAAEQQHSSIQYPQQTLHTHIINSDHANDYYHVQSDQDDVNRPTTPSSNLVFVTISTPEAQESKQTYSQEPQVIPARPIKSPHEFVSDAMAYHSQHYQAPQPEITTPKPANAGYTYVEVQKSINIHNKLITEKDGRLIEQHETIYPDQKYKESVEIQQQQNHPQPPHEYVSLSQNPIHVEQEEEQYEPAASVHNEQHISNPSQAANPTQDLPDFGIIQQSNLIQESHIVETPQQLEIQQEHYDEHESHDPHAHHDSHAQHDAYAQLDPHEHHNHAEQEYQTVYAASAPQAGHHHEDNDHHENPNHSKPEYQPVYAASAPQTEHLHEEAEHVVKELSQEPLTPPLEVPQALPFKADTYPAYQLPPPTTPLVLQEIVEKHIPVPYAIPEPVGIPVHIQHFIDRPFPVETIVEKPVPYPLEKVVENVVEKHVPVEVEKIVEKPVEVVVKKFIDRPVAIPIKIPVALHFPAPIHGPLSPYGHSGGHYPPVFDHASTWPQSVNGASFARIPPNILKSYYNKMLKKLVPQMQQAYKNAQQAKSASKNTPKPNVKPTYKISDMLYDLKPPPMRAKGISSWDVGARYQYDYNTLPLDLAASSSIAVGKNLERPGQGYKKDFDEFQRWRNGHSLKRSPDFGRNLHVEYGFKPPLVPSVEIDDKGVPLKSVADLTNGKQD
ncbi:uncharacterized protein ACRADG_009905 isoform 1-T2 [Cochliomyia hominivorax]